MKFKRITVQPDDLPDWVKESRVRCDAARDKILDLIEATPTDDPYRQQAVDRFEELMVEYEPLVKRLEDGIEVAPGEHLIASVRYGYWKEFEENLEAIRRYAGN